MSPSDTEVTPASPTGRPATERRRPRGGNPIRVGLLGCGVVGGGVLSLLEKNSAQLAQRVGVPIVVSKILVRDLAKPRAPQAAGIALTTNPDELLNDPDIDVFVEVMGGLELSGRLIEGALSRGRCVVTANKALLAARGTALLELAAHHQVDLAFEAAVGGGIPIIRTLRDAAASDEVFALAGILNGTSNYILTQMSDAGVSFESALAEAQAKGFAEADPSLDIGGHDAAQKLLVLAMLAFGAKPPSDLNALMVEGIAALSSVDIEAASKLGYSVKHLVVGRDHGSAVELRAHPALVRQSSVWANVSGAQNAVKLEGRALGPLFISGRGAGDMPTAVSVVADLIEVGRSLVAGVPGMVTGARPIQARSLMPRSDFELRYYLRFEVSDRPGVLARIASSLAEHGVSLSQVSQSEGKGERARIILVTHQAREGAVRSALQSLTPLLPESPVVLRIEEL